MENNQMSVTELIDDVRSKICFDYCKWPDKAESEDELFDEHCAKCPLAKLL